MSFFQKHSMLWRCIAFLLVLVAGRILLTHALRFSFLAWNIFLAVIPLALSHYTARLPQRHWAVATALLWLLFFPNAAYLFTDIIHLRHSASLLYWLDLMILYLAGFYGLYINMYSLQEMERWYGSFLSGRAKSVVTTGLLFLSGYGIYLGRVERWNSWDVVAQPVDLLSAMLAHSRHPLANREVWMMSGLFGLGLFLLYALFRQVIAAKLSSD